MFSAEQVTSVSNELPLSSMPRVFFSEKTPSIDAHPLILFGEKEQMEEREHAQNRDNIIKSSLVIAPLSHFSYSDGVRERYFPEQVYLTCIKVGPQDAVHQHWYC